MQQPFLQYPCFSHRGRAHAFHLLPRGSPVLSFHATGPLSLLPHPKSLALPPFALRRAPSPRAPRLAPTQRLLLLLTASRLPQCCNEYSGRPGGTDRKAAPLTTTAEGSWAQAVSGRDWVWCLRQGGRCSSWGIRCCRHVLLQACQEGIDTAYWVCGIHIRLIPRSPGYISQINIKHALGGQTIMNGLTKHGGLVELFIIGCWKKGRPASLGSCAQATGSLQDEKLGADPKGGVWVMLAMLAAHKALRWKKRTGCKKSHRHGVMVMVSRWADGRSITKVTHALDWLQVEPS